MARRLPPPPDVARTTSTQHRWALEQELDEVLIRWFLDATLSEQTLARMSETVQRFANRLAATGVGSFRDVTPAQARGFVMAPLPDGFGPEVHTQHARRTAVRVLYRTLRVLGYDVGDPTLDLALPPRGVRVARPLTEDEVTLCRASAQATPGRRGWMRATAWALGEATAVSSEIAAVRIRDLDHPVWPTAVTLPGTRRIRPREVDLTGWGCLVLTERARDLAERGANPGTLLAYGGSAPAGGAKAQASVCNALRDVLDSAGLSGESDVRPSSLRHWAGRSYCQQGATIQAVARHLGHRSLDATAEDIALDWDHDPADQLDPWAVDL